MQFQNGRVGSERPLVVNCDRSQRSASWSYSTMGSPEGSVQSGTAKFAQSEPVSTGPRRRVPFLEYTARPGHNLDVVVRPDVAVGIGRVYAETKEVKIILIRQAFKCQQGTGYS